MVIGKWGDVSGKWEWYARTKLYVYATQVWSNFQVETPDGIRSGKAGDYLVEVRRGVRYPMSREVFESTYKPLNRVEG